MKPANGYQADLHDMTITPEGTALEVARAVLPYMLVIGDREVESDSVSVRHRKHADMGAKPVDQFIAEVRALVETKNVIE